MTDKKYTYTRLKEIQLPGAIVNVYGGIIRLQKQGREINLHIQDETAIATVRIVNPSSLCNVETAFQVKDIIRLHRSKVLEPGKLQFSRGLSGNHAVVWDGKSQSTFPKFSSSPNNTLAPSDDTRVAELKAFIESISLQNIVIQPSVSSDLNRELYSKAILYQVIKKSYPRERIHLNVDKHTLNQVIANKTSTLSHIYTLGESFNNNLTGKLYFNFFAHVLAVYKLKNHAIVRCWDGMLKSVHPKLHRMGDSEIEETICSFEEQTIAATWNYSVDVVVYGQYWIEKAYTLTPGQVALFANVHTNDRNVDETMITMHDGEWNRRCICEVPSEEAPAIYLEKKVDSTKKHLGCEFKPTYNGKYFTASQPSQTPLSQFIAYMEESTLSPTSPDSNTGMEDHREEEEARRRRQQQQQVPCNIDSPPEEQQNVESSGEIQSGQVLLLAEEVQATEQQPASSKDNEENQMIMEVDPSTTSDTAEVNPPDLSKEVASTSDNVIANHGDENCEESSEVATNVQEEVPPEAPVVELTSNEQEYVDKQTDNCVLHNSSPPLEVPETQGEETDTVNETEVIEVISHVTITDVVENPTKTPSRPDVRKRRIELLSYSEGRMKEQEKTSLHRFTSCSTVNRRGDSFDQNIKKLKSAVVSFDLSNKKDKTVTNCPVFEEILPPYPSSSEESDYYENFPTRILRSAKRPVNKEVHENDVQVIEQADKENSNKKVVEIETPVICRTTTSTNETKTTEEFNYKVPETYLKEVESIIRAKLLKEYICRPLHVPRKRSDEEMLWEKSEGDDCSLTKFFSVDLASLMSIAMQQQESVFLWNIKCAECGIIEVPRGTKTCPTCNKKSFRVFCRFKLPIKEEGKKTMNIMVSRGILHGSMPEECLSSSTVAKVYLGTEDDFKKWASCSILALIRIFDKNNIRVDNATVDVKTDNHLSLNVSHATIA